MLICGIFRKFFILTYNRNMDTKATISDKVKELRKSRGLLQQQLADRAGVSMQTISNLENGRHVPDTSTLLKIAEALDVSLGDLIG